MGKEEDRDDDLPKYADVRKCRHKCDQKDYSCDNEIDLRLLEFSDFSYCTLHIPRTSDDEECIAPGCKRRRTHGYGTMMTPKSAYIYTSCLDHAKTYMTCLKTLENTLGRMTQMRPVEQPIVDRRIKVFRKDNKCFNSIWGECKIKKFSMFKRRHHCRECWESFCKECCNDFKTTLNQWGISERVCKKCMLRKKDSESGCSSVITEIGGIYTPCNYDVFTPTLAGFERPDNNTVCYRKSEIPLDLGDVQKWLVGGPNPRASKVVGTACYCKWPRALKK